MQNRVITLTIDLVLIEIYSSLVPLFMEYPQFLEHKNRIEKSLSKLKEPYEFRNENNLVVKIERRVIVTKHNVNQ